MLNRDGKEYTPCFILDGDEVCPLLMVDALLRTRRQIQTGTHPKDHLIHGVEQQNDCKLELLEVAQQVTHFTSFIQLT